MDTYVNRQNLRKELKPAWPFLFSGAEFSVRRGTRCVRAEWKGDEKTQKTPVCEEGIGLAAVNLSKGSSNIARLQGIAEFQDSNIPGFQGMVPTACKFIGCEVPWFQGGLRIPGNQGCTVPRWHGCKIPGFESSTTVPQFQGSKVARLFLAAFLGSEAGSEGDKARNVLRLARLQVVARVHSKFAEFQGRAGQNAWGLQQIPEALQGSRVH